MLEFGSDTNSDIWIDAEKQGRHVLDFIKVLAENKIRGLETKFPGKFHNVKVSALHPYFKDWEFQYYVYGIDTNEDFKSSVRRDYNVGEVLSSPILK